MTLGTQSSQQPASVLSEALALPCGLTLKNRLAKAAMTEQLAKDGSPPPGYVTLYRAFADGGAGLIITGNLMVARAHREHPRNVVIDERTDEAVLRTLVEATRHGGAMVGQISHPGRQAVWSSEQPVAPSASRIQGLGPYFREARALSIDDITDVTSTFVRASETLQRCGFAGVQLHAAHGYLLSQFLSPRVNQRTDQYGGSLANRARLLLDVVDRVRAAVKPEFAVMVKLNSADFQRGGFDEDDALQVMQWLEPRGVDAIEISGGSYEAPAMVGLARDTPVRASTAAREAYFLTFAQRARSAVKVPLMVTGGFRTPAAMAEALTSGACDLIGIARPFALSPALARAILSGSLDVLPTARDRFGLRFVDAVLSSSIYVENMHRIAHGQAPSATVSCAWTFAHALWMARGFGR